jgi:hypothetical protein
VASKAIDLVMGSKLPIACSFLNALILINESVSLPLTGCAYAVCFKQAAEKNNTTIAIEEIKIVREVLIFIKNY